jgi:Histone deacetylase domain
MDITVRGGGHRAARVSRVTRNSYPTRSPLPARMNDRRLTYVYAPAIEGMSYPPDCPFKTQRATLARSKIISFGLLGGPGREEVAARQATLSELKQIHSAAYLAELQRAAAGDLTAEGFRMGLATPDTPVFADLFDYGAWACGAGLVAADLLLENRADIAFNLLGGFHHAMPARAGGFCYLNDVALAWRTCAGEGDEDAFSMGLGGVMLGSTEWAGGLRDRQLPVTAEHRAAVAAELQANLEQVIEKVFPFHGLAQTALATTAASG